VRDRGGRLRTAGFPRWCATGARRACGCGPGRLSRSRGVKHLLGDRRAARWDRGPQGAVAEFAGSQCRPDGDLDCEGSVGLLKACLARI